MLTRETNASKKILSPQCNSTLPLGRKITHPTAIVNLKENSINLECHDFLMLLHKGGRDLDAVRYLNAFLQFQSDFKFRGSWVI